MNSSQKCQQNAPNGKLRNDGPCSGSVVPLAVGVPIKSNLFCSVKVLKSLLEEGGPNVAENPHHRDIYRHIYDLIWQAVRDKVGIFIVSNPKFVLKMKY